MKTHRLLALATTFLLAVALHAQQVAQPELEQLAATGTVAPADTAPAPVVTTGSSSRRSGTDDDVVQMSVFRVTSAQDEGYAAVATAAGSRINTPLRDVAASISPFTEDFLNDIGAESLDDILSYAPNIESDFGDASGDYESTLDSTLVAGAANNDFRARGIKGTTLIDGVQTAIPIGNRYNIDRAEFSLGANSILFGIGAQGGVLALTTKRANVQRNRLTLKQTLGTWSSSPVTGIPYQQTTLDYNLVLIPRKMAFRLNGLYVNNKDWQYWKYLDDKRLAPSFTAKPFKNTTIYAGYEGGRRQESPSRRSNLLNSYSQWDAAGRQVMGDFVTDSSLTPLDANGKPIPSITMFNAGNPTINYYVYVNNDDALYNLQRCWQTPQNNSATYMFGPDQVPWTYSFVGPGGKKDSKFNSWFVSLEQHIGNLSFELSYLHNQNDSWSIRPDDARATLQGDPNLYISPPIYNDATMASRIDNTHAGQLYLEDLWDKDTNYQKNDTVRLTATYQLNLKKYGRHSIIGFIERTSSELNRATYDEVFLDDNQTPPHNTSPEHTSNRIRRRQYITEGDYTTYYQGDPSTPLTDIAIFNNNGVLGNYHSAWVLQKTNIAHVKTTITSAMLALQSNMFKNRLATIFGLRLDDASFRQEWPPIRISDPADPRYYKVLNGTKALNEYDFNNTWRSGSYKPYTFSAGGVYHLPWLGNRLSLTANYSTNRGLPELDGRTVLPTGNTPPLSKGSTFDYGIRFDVFADGKLTGRLTRFDTRQYDAADIVPNNVGDDWSQQLGSTNLWNIYDALFYLRPTGHDGLLDGDDVNTAKGRTSALIIHPDGSETLVNTIDHLGPMTPQQYAVFPSIPQPGMPGKPTYPNGAPPQYNAALVDTISKGYELELTGQITKNFSVRLNLAYTDRNRVKMMQEIADYYTANIPIWMAMADPAQNGGTQYYVNITGQSSAPSGPTATFPTVITRPNPNSATTPFILMPLQDYIWNQLYALTGNTTIGENSSVRGNNSNGLIHQMLVQTGQLGSSPWKGRLTLTYKFPNTSFLKGLAASVGCRWESGREIPDPNRLTTTYTIPPRNQTTFDFDPSFYYNNATMLSGQTWLSYDCMLRYKMKILGGKTNLTLQLNINNVFNKHDPLISRLYSDYTTVTSYYIQSPRQFRLSATLDF